MIINNNFRLGLVIQYCLELNSLAFLFCFIEYYTTCSATHAITNTTHTKPMKAQLTNKLKPVTEAKEVAIEAAESCNWPRCPTNITDIICRE